MNNRQDRHVTGTSLPYYNSQHGDGQTQTRSTADHVGGDDGLPDRRKSSVLHAIESGGSKSSSRPTRRIRRRSSGPKAPTRSWRASPDSLSGPSTRGPRYNFNEPWLQDTSTWAACKTTGDSVIRVHAALSHSGHVLHATYGSSSARGRCWLALGGKSDQHSLHRHRSITLAHECGHQFPIDQVVDPPTQP